MLFVPTWYPCTMMFVLLNNSTTSTTNVSGIAYLYPSGSTRTPSMVFSGMHVVQSLVFYIVLCWPFLYFCFYWILDYLYLFDLRASDYTIGIFRISFVFICCFTITNNNKRLYSERTENKQHLSKRSIYHQEHCLKSQPTRIGNRSHWSLISMCFVKRNIYCVYKTPLV